MTININVPGVATVGVTLGDQSVKVDPVATPAKPTTSTLPAPTKPRPPMMVCRGYGATDFVVYTDPSGVELGPMTLTEWDAYVRSRTVNP